MKNEQEKATFTTQLKEFAGTLNDLVSQNDEWTIRGFIDLFKNVYTISSDTKVVSKILELHLFPHLLAFAERTGYTLELASCQNWYPDLTFISKNNPDIMFAVDLKTTYRDENYPDFVTDLHLVHTENIFRSEQAQRIFNIPIIHIAGIFAWVSYIQDANLSNQKKPASIPLMKLKQFPQ